MGSAVYQGTRETGSCPGVAAERPGSLVGLSPCRCPRDVDGAGERSRSTLSPGRWPRMVATRESEPVITLVVDLGDHVARS